MSHRQRPPVYDIAALRLGCLPASCLAFPPYRPARLRSGGREPEQRLHDIAPLFEAAHPGRCSLTSCLGAAGADAGKGRPLPTYSSGADEGNHGPGCRPGSCRAAARSGCRNALGGHQPAAPRCLPRYRSRAAWARHAIGLPASVPVGRYTRGVPEGQARAGRRPAPSGAPCARDYGRAPRSMPACLRYTDAAIMPGKVKSRLHGADHLAHPFTPDRRGLAGAPKPGEAAKFLDFLFTLPAQAVLAKYGLAALSLRSSKHGRRLIALRPHPKVAGWGPSQPDPGRGGRFRDGALALPGRDYVDAALTLR